MQFWAVVARQTAEEHSLKHRLACAAIAGLSFALDIAAQSDWTTYGYDAGQTKYSPLDQINTSNVDQLTQAWVYHMKPAAPAPAAPRTEPPYERTSPWGMYALFWDKDSVPELDATTGKILWDIQMDIGAYVTPSTFMGRDEKQYVVIVDTGGSFFDRTNGDSILAFALPSK